MTGSDRPGLWLALLGGLLLGLATPPAHVPFGEWLVVPGLMLWFAIASNGRRPHWQSYLLGCVHMAWFSWSVRHVLLPAYVAIVVVGGLYYLLATTAVRAAPTRVRALAFGVAVAGSFWLRAVMPEIHYPHGQACHALWQWPSLLRSVAVGGEPLANLLLAWLAASLLQVVRSWRVAKPTWRTAWLGAAFALAALLVCNLLGYALAPSVEIARQTRVHAIEPGYHPAMFASAREWQRLWRERLLEPTQRELQATPTPDLVAWPESSVMTYPYPRAEDVAAGRHRILAGLLPASDARLVVGGNVAVPNGTAPTSFLVEAPSGRVLARQDKLCLVPGGEFLPLLALLPDGLAQSVREAFAAAMQAAPDCIPGEPGALFETAGGVPFASLMCYDNAFHGPAAAQVAAGAQLLLVLSNESWYRGGGELTQLVAMSVIRALETSTPLVRCTTDGWSVAIDADGRIVAELPQATAPQPGPRILRVSVTSGPGRAAPMAWLQQTFGPICGVLLALGAAHSLLRRVRIRSASSAVPEAGGSGSPDRSSGAS